MSKVKKQHYLPRFYLKNFADENGRLCVVDSTVDTPLYRSRIQDIAQGRYYYDFLGDGDNQTLEGYFGKMEDLLAPYFAEVLELASIGLSLSERHKFAIYKFIELQFLRSDWMRQHISQDLILKNFKPDYIQHGEGLIHAYIIKEKIMVELLEYIVDYEFLVLTSEIEDSLFTSSFPIFFNNEGDILELIAKLVGFKEHSVGTLDSNLFFPISSNYCVYIYDRTKPTEIRQDKWFSSFVTSGFSWSNKRIYFRETATTTQLYPMMKPLLNLRRS